MEKKRFINLDLLRVISMLMIVTLHYLGKGGALHTTNNVVRIVVWFIEYLSLVSVNIYVFISSYFLVDSKFKWGKVLSLLFEVWFYSLILLVLGIFICDNISITEIISSIFPITNSHYWFITIYLFMYILSPFINILINNMSKRQHFNLIMILTIAIGIINLIKPIFDNTKGYGIIWFVSLYFISSYIKKYVKTVNIHKYKYLIIYIGTTALLTIIQLILRHFSSNSYLIENLCSGLLGYNNIFILISSLSLFMYFRGIEIRNKIVTKIVSVLASSTFGVYLIHENLILRTRIYSGILHSEKYTHNGILKFILILIISVLAIYIISTLIDMIRIQVFKIIGRMKNKNSNCKIISKFDKFIDKLINTNENLK